MLQTIEVAEGERKIDAVLRRLAEGVGTIQDSSQFRLFLTTMAKFHKYSISNLMLIAMQKPNVTYVAGFVTWKDLGRWVKAGEKGIAILAPIFPPKATCPKCGSRLPKDAKYCPKCREPVEVEIEVSPRYFTVVNVFDISQTEGKPLPEFEVPVLTGEANEELFSRLLSLMKQRNVTVSFESRPDQDPNIKGQYLPPTQIWVRPEESRAQQVKSLTHEVAHYYTEGVFQIPRRDAETIAESVAFVVGAHYGFDSGVRSFPYVALWSQDKKVLEKNLTTIRQVSGAILDGLEKMPAGGEKFLPALKPFEPYHFAEYVLRSNTFSLNEIPIYSGLSGTNPLRVPDHIWQEVLAGIDGEFVKQGDLYAVKTPGIERPPYMRAAPTWREIIPLVSTLPSVAEESLPQAEAAPSAILQIVWKHLKCRKSRPPISLRRQHSTALYWPEEHKITIREDSWAKMHPAERRLVIVHEALHACGAGHEPGYRTAVDTMATLMYKNIWGEDEYWRDFIRELEKRMQRFLASTVPLPDEELALMTQFLAETEDDPLRKFCCRQCGECAPRELLEEGKFPERIDWLRHHYAEKHPSMWGKIQLLPLIHRGEKTWYLGEWWEQEYSTADAIVYRSADGKKRLYVYWDGTKEVKPVEGGLEYNADSPEFLSQTIEDAGLREQLDKTFAEAVARTHGT